MTRIRRVWVDGSHLVGPSAVPVDPPLAPGEVEIDLSEPEPPRTITPTIDAAALADLLEMSVAS